MRLRRLKLGTHVDSGQVYCVYRNQAAAAYSYFYFLICLPLQFSNIKIFRHTFLRTVRPRRLKRVPHMHIGGCIVYTRIRLLLVIHPFIFSFFSLSNFQTLKCFVTLFSRTVRPKRWKHVTHVDNGWMHHCIPESCCCSYSSFFQFLSLQFSSIKTNRHTFLRNCEA